MKAHLPEPSTFLGSTIDSDFVLEELVGKGCNALVFRGHSKTLGYYAAYKVVPSQNLATGEKWAIEPKKANSLEHEAVVHCQAHFDWRDKLDCVILKYQYVDGISLRDYIKTKRSDISIPFIVQFLQTILELFFEMTAKGLTHGDLHDGNVLVTRPSQFQRSSAEKFKVTDFGIGSLTSGARHLDDYEQLAAMLADLLRCLNYGALNPQDKFTYDVLQDHFVAKHLREKDRTLDPIARDPDALLQRLESIQGEYATAQSAGEKLVLLTPFDYLSCEQIGEKHSLLAALYSDKFLGIGEIEGANNLVVTGPRGCGKSTVFRSLSLKHQLAAGATSWKTQSYIGIYYHCQDLYFKFPRYTVPTRQEAIDLPIHYITCRLLVEILDVLQQVKFLDDKFAIREQQLSKSLWELLSLNRPGLPGSDTFAALVTLLTRECQWTVEKHRFASKGDQPIKQLYGPETLLTVCALIQAEIPALGKRPFYFFIDDYSTPHITEALQRNLNRLLMSRNEFCFFKMATESSVSFAASDIDDKQYVEGRELEILNLGLIYLRGDKARKLDFLDDVFARRLGAVPDYPATSLEALIGGGDNHPHNAVAERLAEGEKPEWWGRSVLVDMCSGDIHQLITVVRKMVSNAGGRDALVAGKQSPMVDKQLQNRAIRRHAGDFLQSLADSGPHGERLRKIVSAFGNVAHSYVKFRRSKNESGNPRHQASRIELHEMPVLDGEAKEIYDLLLRYSVFIQDPRGKSRRGQPVPRLYLRRFLIPHFNLTFNMRDSLLFEAEDFIQLLLDPVSYENRSRLKKETTPSDDDGGSQLGLGI